MYKVRNFSHFPIRILYTFQFALSHFRISHFILPLRGFCWAIYSLTPLSLVLGGSSAVWSELFHLYASGDGERQENPRLVAGEVFWVFNDGHSMLHWKLTVADTRDVTTAGRMTS